MTDRQQKKQVEALHEVLLHWYAHHARSFGWREQHHNPYVVLVSEVMLQQTQTARVEQKLPQFLALFPSPAELAQADNATIIRAWQGMGYNNRALRLRDCARAIMERHGGEVPRTMEELLALPGIGRYTASAILVFAYAQDLPVVDVNIQRVYSRVFKQMGTTAEVLPEKEIHELSAQVYPSGSSSAWHQAVMDLSALYCSARAPRCSICPVGSLCHSASAMKEEKKQKRPEPSWRGEPNRIWRGRVVEILRSVRHGEWMTVQQLIDRLLKHELFREEGTDVWLAGLLDGLRRDAIIAVQPATDFTDTRIQLQQ